MDQMTQATNNKDHESFDPGQAPSDVLRRPVFVMLLLLAIAAIVGADLVMDRLEGGSLSHAAVELVAMFAALVGAALLVRDLLRARARTKTLARELASSHRDVQRYREEAADLLRGLGETIDRQLDRWGLTEAEKEVAILLLKGLSLQEVADVRGTSERTSRKQARAVYAKAELEGRAELSAFFLEDLLPPR
jgi:DNA-binding CsgD family transcriptional regulator